ATWGTAAYDSADGYVLWYGGGMSTASVSTWKFVGGSWTNLTGGLATNPTPARFFTSMAYDPGLGETVLFGGWNGSEYLSDTWVFTGGDWSAVSPSTPPARVGAGLAFDSSDGYLLLTGGGTASGSLSDSWKFTSGGWTELLGTNPPTGIGGPEGLAPAPGGGVVAWGGVGCSTPGVGPCNFTYEYYSGSWHDLGAVDGPSPRNGMQLTYDASDGAVLGWGGRTAAGPANDTWALGGPLHLRTVVSPSLVGEDDETEFLAYAGGGYGGFSYSWSGVPPDCPLVNASIMTCESEIPNNYTIAAHLVDTAGNSTTGFATLRILFKLSTELFITPSIVDTGEPVLLRVVVSGGAPVVNFSWSGLPVGCQAATWAEVNCTPVDPGYYIVEVQTVDELGHATLSPALGLTVAAIPTVGFWSNATIGTAPMAVQFQSAIFGGVSPYTYAWSFGDGGISTNPDPAHTYPAEGVYAVGLTVTDSVGGVAAASSSTSIDVLNPLSIQPRASATYPQVGQTVTFNVTVTGGSAPYGYGWTFGDGGSSNAPDPTHAFGSSGDHSVVLIVTDSHGVQSEGTVVVDVQGTTGATSSSNSLLTSPWLAGVIGALIGVVVTAIALRPATGPPRDPPAPRRDVADHSPDTSGIAARAAESPATDPR
ncbi:MAG: PKD domain-containing protein, partial [Thermoplasmata archaeon]|nr:PKD domain-containing protein [Thermoplasmata archaeon]